MLLHAHRRRGETITVDFDGAAYAFAPNDRGDVVGDVKDAAHAKHLLENTDGYVKYGEKPAPAAVQPAATATDGADTTNSTEAPQDGPGKFVLTNSKGERVDLAAMTDAEVRKWAKEQSVKVANTMTGDKLRTIVVKALRAE
jgi:hypothetical protein